MRQVGTGRTRRRRARAHLAGAVLGVLAVAGATMAVGPAPAQATATPKQKVVTVVTRLPYGTMLATVKGLSLYTSALPCTGPCLTAWPPLLMGPGKSVPKGVVGLGTVPFTGNGTAQLQVTYHGSALYRFVADSGTSVNGNGLSGFTVALR